MGRPNMVIWVVYSTGNMHAELIDKFSACISTNVLTFNEAQKKRVLDFRCSAAQSGQESDMDFWDNSLVHLLQPKWPTRGVTESWKQFVADIEKIPLKPSTFKGETLNLTNFIPFLHAMVHIVNQSTQIPEITSANIRNKKGVANHADHVETNTGIETQNLHDEDMGNTSGGTDDDKMKWRTIIGDLNMNLQNMYDDYVCFQGSRDRNQMEKMLECVCRQAKTMWEVSKIDKYYFNLDKFEARKNKIIASYKKDNLAIIAREKEQTRQVIQVVKTEYKHKLKEYMQQETSVHCRRDLDAIHHIMKTHCIAVATRSMAYGGKFNNVVHENLKHMEQGLNHHFEHLIESVKFECKLEEPEQSHQDPILAYHENLAKIMSSVVGDMTVWKQEHAKMVEKAVHGLVKAEREELALILETHWMNMVEAQFSISGLSPRQPEEHCLGMHLTNPWVGLIVGSDTLSRQICFPGFPAAVACWRENPPFYKWGNDAIAGRHEHPPHFMGYLLHFISYGMGNAELTQNMITKFIHGTKGWMENTVQIPLHGLLLTVPSWLTFTERNLLRKCSNLAALKGVTILTESSLAAYQHFCSIPLPQDGSQDSLILVVISRAEFIRLEIFGRHIENGETNGILMLAIASEKLPQIGSPRHGTHLESLPQNYVTISKQLYGNALTQLEQTRRHCVKYFLTTTDVNGWETAFDPFFLHEEKLTKVGSIGSMAYNGLSTFCMSRTKLHKFLHVLATTPKSVAGRWIPKKVNTPIKEHNIGELMKWKASLLEKCGRMEAQISDGSVQVGRLTTRIITEAINNCKVAAAEDRVDGEEAKEIHELFKIHNFK